MTSENTSRPAAKPKLTDEERSQLANELDQQLDDFINVMAEKSKSRAQQKEPFNFDKFCEELDQHPAFMRDLKAKPDGEYSEGIQALQAMKYDELDDDDAEQRKLEGNKFFRLNKFRWARDAYTNGIKIRSSDAELNSVLYGNRAAAQRRLGNLSSAVRDCLFALKFNVRNLKAALRGADCLLELGYAHRCIDWNKWFQREFETRGGDKEGDEFQKFENDMREVLTKAESRLKIEERDERRKKIEKRRIQQEKHDLLAAFKERQLKFTPPIDLADEDGFELDEICIRSPYTHEKLQERVYVDRQSKNSLIWPLLLVYIGQGQTDMIKDCNEESTLSDLLSPVFAEPAPWDAENFEYRINNVRFFLPLDIFDDRQLQELDLTRTLRETLSLSNHYILQGLPLIHVYTKKRADKELRHVESERYRCS